MLDSPIYLYAKFFGVLCLLAICMIPAQVCLLSQ